MTLEENISAVIAKKLEDGTIEKIVEEKFTSAIDSAIGDIFSWGDGKKALKEKFKEIMVPVIEKHDFSEYIVKLDTVLTEIVNRTTLADNKDILEAFKYLMIEPTSKEVKLSQIFDAYKEYVSSQVDTDDLDFYEGTACVEAYLEFEEDEERRYFKSSFDNATVTFSCDHDDKEALTYTLDLYKDKDKDVWSMYSRGADISLSSLTTVSKFEIFILNLKRTFANIIVDIKSDSDDVEIEEEY